MNSHKKNLSSMVFIISLIISVQAYADAEFSFGNWDGTAPEIQGDCSLNHSISNGDFDFSIAWNEGSSIDQRKIKLVAMIKPNSKSPEISNQIKPGIMGGITGIVSFIFQRDNIKSPIKPKNITFIINEFDRINGNKINQDWMASIIVETGKKQYVFKSRTSKPFMLAGMGNIPANKRITTVAFNVAEQVGKHKALLLSEDVFHALTYGDLRVQVNDFDSNTFLFAIDETLLSNVKNKKGQKENLLNALVQLDNAAIDMINKGLCPNY
ncbi:MAG: hypothetical protein KAT04_08165 [Methylococcales bacterium]|nr:hypothetical protein [Methylococcales bacterium]